MNTNDELTVGGRKFPNKTLAAEARRTIERAKVTTPARDPNEDAPSPGDTPDLTEDQLAANAAAQPQAPKAKRKGTITLPAAVKAKAPKVSTTPAKPVKAKSPNEARVDGPAPMVHVVPLGTELRLSKKAKAELAAREGASTANPPGWEEAGGEVDTDLPPMGVATAIAKGKAHKAARDNARAHGPEIIAAAAKAARKGQPVVPAAAKDPRVNKGDLVIAMLQRKEGATNAELMEATGWQAHSVRGFLAGTLRKKGYAYASEEQPRGSAAGNVRVYRITSTPGQAKTTEVPEAI